MSAAENIVPPPPYVIPVDVKVYDLHSPFSNATREQAQSSVPVYTNSPCIQKFVSFETVLGRSPGMTTCTSCQQQVMTNIFYKIGGFAWLMCFVFILCGLHSVRKWSSAKWKKVWHVLLGGTARKPVGD